MNAMWTITDDDDDDDDDGDYVDLLTDGNGWPSQHAPCARDRDRERERERETAVYGEPSSVHSDLHSDPPGKRQLDSARARGSPRQGPWGPA